MLPDAPARNDLARLQLASPGDTPVKLESIAHLPLSRFPLGFQDASSAD